MPLMEYSRLSCSLLKIVLVLHALVVAFPNEARQLDGNVTSPYQEELDRTFAKMLGAAVTETSIAEVVELEEIPSDMAKQPLLGISLRTSFESTGIANRCVLRSQSGRRTVVDEVRLRGSLAWPFAYENALTDYAVLFGFHFINSSTLRLHADRCANRTARSPRQIYSVPAIEVPSESELREGVGEQQSVGDLIEQCERRTSLALEIPCEFGGDFEISILPNSGIAGVVEPREVIDLTYNPALYILQIFTVLALALETLFVGGTLIERKQRKFSILEASPRSKWLLALVVSAAIMIVTGILSVSSWLIFSPQVSQPL